MNHPESCNGCAVPVIDNCYRYYIETTMKERLKNFDVETTNTMLKFFIDCPCSNCIIKMVCHTPVFMCKIFIKTQEGRLKSAFRERMEMINGNKQL